LNPVNPPCKHHRHLDSTRWSSYPAPKQVLSIAVELNRAKNWILKNDNRNVNLCYERAFELVDLTAADPKWKGRTRELMRFREMLAEFYLLPQKDRRFNDLLANTLVALSPESFNALSHESR
jgi:hypothetical protein